MTARGIVGRGNAQRGVAFLPLVGAAEDAAVEVDVEPTGGALDVAEEVLAGLRSGEWRWRAGDEAPRGRPPSSSGSLDR